MDISTKITEKSAEFLKAALKESIQQEHLDHLQNMDALALAKLEEQQKNIFWLNVYNALVQKEVSLMKNTSVDKSIFTKKVVVIAGQDLSLDQIEHGIIRGNFWKYGLGYLPGKYLNEVTQKWKTKSLDPRIHFQLNCGAASCPMVRILNVKNVEQELNWGELDFIQDESTIDEKAKKIMVSGLFLMYLKDFGGRKGVLNLMREHFPEHPYRIGYKKFDWTRTPKKTK